MDGRFVIECPLMCLFSRVHIHIRLFDKLIYVVECVSPQYILKLTVDLPLSQFIILFMNRWNHTLELNDNA